MRFPRFIITIFVLLNLSTCFATSLGDSWKQVNENTFINIEGINCVEDIYGYSFILKSYNKGQYEPINNKEVFYTLKRATIDCGTNKYKIGIIDSYDEYDNFIYGDYNRLAKFQPIVSGTPFSIVANKLCKIKNTKTP